jgi:O-antigen ligase
MTTSISKTLDQAEAQDKTRAPVEKTTLEIQSHADLEPNWAGRLIFLTLCVAIVLSAVAFGTVDYAALAVFQTGAALVVAFWIIDAWITGTLRLSRNVLQWPFIGLIVIGLIQVIPFGSAGDVGGALSGQIPRTLSLDPYATRLTLIQLFALLIYFAAALSYIDSPKRLRAIVRTIVIFGFVLGFVAIIQALISPMKIYGLRQPLLAVPFGPFVNRHNFAGYMEMTLALPLGMLFSGAVEREKRLLYVTAIALMGVALLMSGSRGGMISLVAMIFFLVALSAFRSKVDGIAPGVSARTRHIFLRVGLGMALLLAIGVGVTLIGGESSLSRFMDTVNANDPTTGRTQVWRVTTSVIKAHPVLGAGLGAFGVAFTPFDPHNGVSRAEQAHNDYLQVLADAGIIGAMLGLVFVVALFRMGFERRQSIDIFRRGVATGALAACFAVLVHSFLDFTLHTTSNALLFLTMAALATVDGHTERRVRRFRRRRHIPYVPASEVRTSSRKDAETHEADDEFEDVYEYEE